MLIRELAFRESILASLVAQIVKNLPAIQETQVQSLGWDDPLEKKMATYSHILAWRIPWTEEPGGLHGVTKSWAGLNDYQHFFFFLSYCLPGFSVSASHGLSYIICTRKLIK